MIRRSRYSLEDCSATTSWRAAVLIIWRRSTWTYLPLLLGRWLVVLFGQGAGVLELLLGLLGPLVQLGQLLPLRLEGQGVELGGDVVVEEVHSVVRGHPPGRGLHH